MYENTEPKHAGNCEYWYEQYPWECSCGATPRMSYGEFIALQRAQYLAQKNNSNEIP